MKKRGPCPCKIHKFLRDALPVFFIALGVLWFGVIGYTMRNDEVGRLEREVASADSATSRAMGELAHSERERVRLAALTDEALARCPPPKPTPTPKEICTKKEPCVSNWWSPNVHPTLGCWWHDANGNDWHYSVTP